MKQVGHRQRARVQRRGAHVVVDLQLLIGARCDGQQAILLLEGGAGGLESASQWLLRMSQKMGTW